MKRLEQSDLNIDRVKFLNNRIEVSYWVEFFQDRCYKFFYTMLQGNEVLSLDSNFRMRYKRAQV